MDGAESFPHFLETKLPKRSVAPVRSAALAILWYTLFPLALMMLVMVDGASKVLFELGKEVLRGVGDE